MRQHLQAPAAAYVNWVGRTVRQIHEEAALREALTGYLDANAAALANADPQLLRRQVIAFVEEQRRAGTLALTPPEPTPIGWQMRNLLNLVGVPLLLLIASPLLLLYLPLFLWQLRRRETRDRKFCPDPTRNEGLQSPATRTTTSPIRISSAAT